MTDPRDPIDARVNTPAREGLTGTAPATLYPSVDESEQITIAPDGRPLEEQPAWRRDFPIDWPQDHYVARRDFLKFMVLTSLAFTVGQFWIGVQSWWRGRRGPMEGKRVASLREVAAAGGVVMFTYPAEKDDCFLVRHEDGLVAYSQQCTHLSCAVIPDPARGLVKCPCHDGYFDLRSGRPLSGPPQRPLPRVRLEVRSDGIYATGIEWRTV